MLKFEYSSLINTSVKNVWEFHQRKDILQLLTPPWQPVKVIRREGDLEIGATSEFVLTLGFIPIPWIARHTEYEQYHYFTDEQIKGPMKSWRHQHLFTEKDEKTQLCDRIFYEIPGGWLSEFLLGWWVNSRLKEMFKYRHQITKQYCESHLN
jgi:ligand-binding SRPBCC domain-containing protein